MNFEPANPPLLDPYILEQFTEEEIRKSEQNMRHQYVLRRLQDFLPKQNKNNDHHLNLNNVSNNNLNSNNVLNVRLRDCQNHFNNIVPNRLNLSITNVFSSSSNVTSHSNVTSQKHFSPPVVMKCSRSAKPLIRPSSVPILPKPPSFTPNVSLEGLVPNVTLSQAPSHPLSHPRTPSPLHSSPSPPPGASNPVVKPRATKRFSYSQSCILEEFFQKYGSARIVDRVALAQKLGLYKNDVIGWFQSRRRKERRAMIAKREQGKGLLQGTLTAEQGLLQGTLTAEQGLLQGTLTAEQGLLRQQIYTSESVR